MADELHRDQLSPGAREDSAQTVQFHYIKSNGYRVILADGAIGQITPKGRIMFSLYNERAALPRLVTHGVTESGDIGEVVSTEGRAGFVREMEVGVMMDREAAEGLRNWLTKKIEDWDNLVAQGSGEKK